MAEIQKYFGSNLKLSGPLHSNPLEWFCPNPSTSSKELLRVVPDKALKRALIRKKYIATVAVSLTLIQGIHGVESEKNLILPFMLIHLLCVSLFYLYVSNTKAAEVAGLVNAFIQFDKMYPKQATKLADLPLNQLFGMVMAKLIFFSQVFIPFGVVFGFHINDPTNPSLAGFWLIPKVDNETETWMSSKYIAHAIKASVLLFNYWLWNFLVAASVLNCGLIFNLCTISILDCIEM